MVNERSLPVRRCRLTGDRCPIVAEVIAVSMNRNLCSVNNFQFHQLIPRTLMKGPKELEFHIDKVRRCRLTSDCCPVVAEVISVSLLDEQEFVFSE